jgi:hypothetical protein
LVGERVTEPVENIIIDSKNIEYIEYEIDLKYKNLNMCFKFVSLSNKFK